MKKFLTFSFLMFIIFKLGVIDSFASTPFKKDFRSQELKYEYQVQKENLQYKKDKKLINRVPTGYMTVDEYERQSEYKDKTTIDYNIPQIQKSADFKYIPKPLYKIVKYNDPPGSPELSLGKKLYTLRQINAQGIVSPSYDKLVYPAVYYYTDSGSVATDLFVIPLEGNDSNLTKILKANVAKRDADPIMSTDKRIDNYEAFRTLTPVDFSTDGINLLVKEKLGSEQDGIWKTRIYVYNFQEKKVYDLSVILEAISYYWKTYRNVELISKRWDIVPIGFSADEPNRVIVKAYGYTGEIPVYLGAWSIDSKGQQSRLISFERNYTVNVSSNGYKIEKDGVETYATVNTEEKMQKKQDKVLGKQIKTVDKNQVKKIKEDYKYELKSLKADYKDSSRDNRELQSLKGSTEGVDIVEKFEDYQQKQAGKNIKKYNKKIQSNQKKVNKLETKIKTLTGQTEDLLNNELNNIYELKDNDGTEESEDDAS